MAKQKKKKLSSDIIRSKKKDTTIKINPFEVKYNKQKHKVLGKKIAKYDKGRPGASKIRELKKRKETLLVELKQSGKANKLIDRRIGENNPDMTLEAKMLQRFAAERQKSLSKAGNFSLNDEDTLTHYGQSLAEIEKFDDPISSDEDDEEKGKIGAKLVAEEHFGGGILKSTKDSDTDKNKSWKERMEDIIAESKKKKFERQHEKEKVIEVTEKLDEEWKQVRALMSMGKKSTDGYKHKNKVDDYDIAVKELHFEMKGKATDRMKSPEEIAAEEKAKLEKLEEDRIRRMKGLESNEAKQQHKSADDLDDGFYMSAAQQGKYEVKYNEGQLLADHKGHEGDDDEGHEGGDDEGHEGGDDSDIEVDDAENEDADDSEEEDSGDDVMAHLSDLESSDESSTEEQEDHEQKKEQHVNNIKHMLKKKKEVMEEARKELPYTFKAPATYEEFESILGEHSTIDKVIIIERIRSCHHPSLAEGNREKLQLLFQFLLTFYGDLALQQPPNFRLMDKLVIHLYQLCQQAPESASKTILALIINKQKQYQELYEAKNGKGRFPTLDVVLYFKLISMLFPTSDLRHPVVTPTMLFMSQILVDSCVQTTRDVALGLLLCNIFYEYVSFAKRFVPEVINFLNGVVFLAIQKNSAKIEPVIPPFKPVGKFINILELNGDCSDMETTCVPAFNLNYIFTPQKAMKYLTTDIFKLKCVKLAVSLLTRFSALYTSLASYREIFKPVCYFCKKLPITSYPQFMQENIQKLIQEIEMKLRKRDRKRLTMAKTKTKALMLFEPKIEENFDPSRKKHADKGKDKNEKQRLIHKHRQELKGAIREIRKDSQFIAKEKLNAQIERDEDRKRKVRELVGSLAMQEGEIKALKRKKSQVK